MFSLYSHNLHLEQPILQLFENLKLIKKQQQKLY